jgi:uncharacterized protein (DUF1330 family)
VTLVVILTVRSRALETFRAFETQAATIMARHGGAIERTVAIPAVPGAETFQEVHIVTFPHAEAFAAYQQDPDLLRAAPLREASVVKTEVLVGEDGPDYRPV